MREAEERGGAKRAAEGGPDEALDALVESSVEAVIEETPGWLRALRVLAVLALVAVIAWLASAGLYKDLTVERVRATVHAQGALGPLLFVVAFTLLQPLGLSAHAFTVGASLLWPPPLAIALAWLGTVGSSLTSFLFSRFVARDWAQRRLPARVRAWEQRLVDAPFRTVLLLRLIFYTTPPVQLMLGASRVPLRAWLPATILGMAPTTIAVALLGRTLLERFGWAP